jgi:alpha-ketoglutarate-dependent taurine dioxygenase
MKVTGIEGKVFGAVVTDVKLTDLGDSQFADIHRALLDHGFLVFPGQFLNEAQSAEFGSRFGPLEFGGVAMSNQRRHQDGTMGAMFDFDSQIMRTAIGNETWHTDSTYKPVSSKCAMLSAVIIPDEGGETELADGRAGYAALDQATKERIEGLSAYHSTEFSQANDLGDFPSVTPEAMFVGVYHDEAYLRPIVKVHPETGVKSLFLGRHAFAIPGLSRDESRALIKQLMDVIVSDESRTYLHHWPVGDTLIWDNRCVLHRARPYDYSKPRCLIGTRVAGDDSELAYYPDDPRAEAGRRALAEELAILREETTGRLFGATTATR